MVPAGRESRPVEVQRAARTEHCASFPMRLTRVDMELRVATRTYTLATATSPSCDGAITVATATLRGLPATTTTVPLTLSNPPRTSPNLPHASTVSYGVLPDFPLRLPRVPVTLPIYPAGSSRLSLTLSVAPLPFMSANNIAHDSLLTPLIVFIASPRFSTTFPLLRLHHPPRATRRSFCVSRRRKRTQSAFGTLSLNNVSPLMNHDTPNAHSASVSSA